MAKILQENTTVNARLSLFVILPSISVILIKKPYFFNYYFEASSSQNLFDILFLIIPPAQ